MNYTDTYRKIYSIIKTDKIPHEQAHSTSLRITAALNQLWVFTQEKPEATEAIIEAVRDFAHQEKIGGYDIDDRI